VPPLLMSIRKELVSGSITRTPERFQKTLTEKKTCIMKPQTVPQAITPSLPKPRVWFDPDGRRYSDDDVLSWVLAAERDRWNAPFELVVGTDSHLCSRDFRFVTVVCIYKTGKGGNYFYSTSYEPRLTYKGNQQRRMYKEVEISIELANWLLEKADVIPVVHCDVSPKGAGQYTSAFSDQLKGYVIGSGFECKIKPESWCANAVADKHSKP